MKDKLLKNINILAVIFLLSCSINLSRGQSIKQVDSVAAMMCDYLRDLKIENDTLKIKNLYSSQLYPYLNKIPKENSEKIAGQIYYRLQRNCNNFKELLDRLDPPKVNAERSKKKYTSTIAKSDMETFKSTTDFYYNEINGAQTAVSMENGIWTDFFTDGSYSKLSYKWINDTEFELVFIESNNESRANLSVPGDVYIYQVLSKQEDHYVMSINIPGQRYYDKFILSFK
ncbi:MAG: hypothetical protein WBG46_15870 [Nonlabens sp.]